MDKALPEDFVRERGYLTLGSRLRRIGERLQADAQVMLKEAGIDVAAALMPTLHALEKGSMTIGELTESLGIAQPGVTRNVGQLEAQGLVQISRNDADKRVRRVSLTPKGAGMVALAVRRLDPWVVGAVGEICDPLDGPLLRQLAALEDGLAAIPLYRRGASSRTE